HVVEGPLLGPDDLVALVPLAGDEHHVALLQERGAELDGGATVGIHQVAALAALRLAGAHPAQTRLLHAAGDLRDDLVRILGARVVAGDHHQFRVFRGHLTHQRALALVPVAPAAKHDHHPTAGKGASGLQRAAEGVVAVGVVHQRHSTLGLDALHPPRDALHAGDALLHVLAAEPRAEGHAG